MPARVRLRSSNDIGSITVVQNGQKTDYSALSRWEWCSDSTGWSPSGYTFETQGDYREGGLIQATRQVGNQTWIYKDYPCGYRRANSARQGFALPAVPTLSTPRLLSQTGPLTAKVNLPLFLFELKDVPKMLRHAGDLLHKLERPSGLSPDKEAASATLAFQFGWKPMVEDILKLCDFAKTVERVQRNLVKSREVNGVRRSITFEELKDSRVFPNTALSSDTGTVFRTDLKVDVTRKSYATVRWVARKGQGISTSTSFADAVRISLGLNRGYVPITIWKALPWTWMIDWFADVSNMLTSSYNQIYYEPKSAWRMSHTEYSLRTPAMTQSGQSLTALEMKWYSKTRVPHSLSAVSNLPTLTLPYMDNFKLSVLGSLAILRIRGAIDG